MNKISFFTVVIAFGFSACDDPILVPKPRAYPKVVYPEHSYRAFDESYCRFTFQYPTYAKVEQSQAYFDEKPKNPCWFNLTFPDFNGQIHCSYYPIASQKDFEKLRNDAFELAGKHNIRADFIAEEPVKLKDGITSGFVFNIEGAVASPCQFFLTDEKRHFLRGALYFNAQSRPDSLAPILEFVRKDMMELVNTFEWK
jgi:gliding motility-associated lipoprotein GldD